MSKEWVKNEWKIKENEKKDWKAFQSEEQRYIPSKVGSVKISSDWFLIICKLLSTKTGSSNNLANS